jgi:3-oxoacyl-[acyl-carrier-protein] synthase-3
VDLIIVATITPDMPFPATACLVQEKIGATNSAAFDLEAACSGFIYALQVGQQFIRSGVYEHVLVIGAEKLSSIIDWTDRNTCVLFGDGAGAALLSHREGGRGMIHVEMGSDGGKGFLLSMPGGGSRCPASAESVQNRQHFLKMDGKETFKNAVQAMCRAGTAALKKAGVSIEDIKCVIPHQANQRIIKAVGDRLGVRSDQVFINLEKYGNTSAASVAIALAEADEQEVIQTGDLVLLVVFGAGLTWGAAVIEW